MQQVFPALLGGVRGGWGSHALTPLFLIAPQLWLLVPCMMFDAFVFALALVILLRVSRQSLPLSTRPNLAVSFQVHVDFLGQLIDLCGPFLRNQLCH